MRKSVVVGFDTEVEALDFISKLPEGPKPRLKCNECGYFWPRNCESSECPDANF